MKLFNHIVGLCKKFDRLLKMFTLLLLKAKVEEVKEVMEVLSVVV